MIKSLKYSVLFPTTKKSFEGTLDFQTGMTCIHGPNEAGKSLVLEFIRYALFGKQALRGKADDYKTLDVDLTFAISGEDYTVQRNRKKEILFKGEDEIAVSASTLNQKIPELLGFNMAVFDISCAANQGDVEALGNMKPTERKRMVDTVVGLDSIEAVQRNCAAKANEFSREASGMAALLVKPEKPKKPKGYKTSKEIVADLEKLEVERKAILEAEKIANQNLTEPQEPEKLSFKESHEELRNIKASRALLVEKLNQLRVEVARIPEAKYSLEEVERQKTLLGQKRVYEEYQKQLSWLPEKTLDSKTIAKSKKAFESLELFKEFDYLTDRIAKDSVSCPSCETSFCLDHDLDQELDQIKAKLPKKRPSVPEFTEKQVRDAELALEAWTKAPEPVPEPEGEVFLTEEDIRNCLEAIKGVEVRRDKQGKIDSLQNKLEGLPNVDLQLEEISAYNVKKHNFDQGMAVYQTWLAQMKEVKPLLAKADKVTEKYQKALDAKGEALLYEGLLNAYNTSFSVYKEGKTKVAEAEAKAEGYQNAVKALKELRARVKAYLVPSLNKVASTLLFKMTNGLRNTIVVDEDFNVEVDGQALNTLSGSGRACANLAIRLGLGQVLTNKVFSVFLGDELDASMDTSRANTTSETLQGLTEYLSQVIVISHKEIDADHFVKLG